MIKLKKIIIILLVSCLVPISFSSAQTEDKELFFVAQKAFEDGFYDVAIRYINQIITQYPDSEKIIQSKLLLGQCYFFQSQYLKAYDIFNSLLQFSEFKDATLFWLGETYTKGSDSKQAEQQYSKLIQLYPKSSYAPHAYYSLGWLYLDQNNYELAKKIFTEFIINFPLHQLAEDASFKLGELAYNEKDFDKTIQLYKNYISKYPESNKIAEAHFYIADAYYYKENYLDALTYYAKSAELAYESDLIFMSKVSLGWCYLKLNKFKLSEQYFSEALELSEEKKIASDDIYFGIANLNTETKQYVKALEAYTKILNDYPNSDRILEAFYGKANIFYLQKKYSLAIKNFMILIDNISKKPNLSSSDKEIFEKANFGIAWSYLKLGDIDLSIKSFERIKDTTKNKIVKLSALTQIGETYQDIGQLQKAIDVYDQILKDYPDNPYIDYVQYRQAIALLRMEKIDSAILSFQTLQANFPDSKYTLDAKYYLGLSYFKTNDFDNAKEHILDFIRQHELSANLMPEAYYILGLTYFNLNNFNESIKTFEKTIKNFPDQTAIIKNTSLNIAKSYYKLNNYKQAVKEFTLIINKYPDSEVSQESIVWLGDYYLENQDFENAINYYETFIRKYPGSNNIHKIYYSLAQAYQFLEKYSEAIKNYKEITKESDPTKINKDLLARTNLAIANIFSKNFDYKLAIEIYENIIKTTPEYERDADIKLAEAYKQSSEFKKSIEYYKNALKAKKGLLDITNAEIQFLIADAEEFLNNSNTAVDEYFKIPYLYPQEKKWIIKAYLRVARIYEKQENWDKAKTIYNNVIEYGTDEIKFVQERLDWIKDNTTE